MLLKFFMYDYSAFFFAAVLFGFAATSDSDATAVVVFFEAALLIRALMDSLFLETPKEPFVRLPFAVFLSPLPISLDLFGRQ
jgi:hypothetical protein